MQSQTTEESPIPVARALDPPPPRAPFPWVTVSLALMCVAIAAAEFLLGGARLGLEIASGPIYWALGAKVPSLVAHGEFWRLVTASFLSATWLHLVVNVGALLAVGRFVEVFYGHARTLVIFVFSAVAGAALSYHLNFDVGLGASTGVMGLIGALAAHNRKYRQFLPPSIHRLTPVVLLFLFLIFAVNVISPWTDGFAHLGGLVGGAVTALLLQSRIAGVLQGEGEWLPLPAAMLATVALLAYGGYGLVSTLPSELALLQAGRAAAVAAEVSHLERALERRPWLYEARVYLMQRLLTQGRLSEAAEQYRLAVANSRGNLKVLQDERARATMAAHFMRRAEEDYRAGRYPEALTSYRTLIDLNLSPEFTGYGHNGYAWTLVDKLNRDYAEAEKHALEATRLAPQNAAVVDTLAWVYYKQGRYEEALQTQQRAVNLAESPEDAMGGRDAAGMAELYYHLGAIQEQLDQRDAARDNYRKALRFQRDLAPATEALKRLERGTAPGRPRPGAPELAQVSGPGLLADRGRLRSCPVLSRDGYPVAPSDPLNVR
jgi:membrane associated rhomboid family serine protease/tetratricopeptide (TPR) repeat protein